MATKIYYTVEKQTQTIDTVEECTGWKNIQVYEIANDRPKQWFEIEAKITDLTQSPTLNISNADFEWTNNGFILNNISENGSFKVLNLKGQVIEKSQYLKSNGTKQSFSFKELNSSPSWIVISQKGQQLIIPVQISH